MANKESDANDPLLDINIDMNDFGVSIESLKSSQENPVDQDAVSPPEPQAPEPLRIPGPLDEIKNQLDSLSKTFESKIRYDEHKNKIIDDLHQALQEYRQGLLQKYVQKIFLDVLKVVDDIRKFSAHYANNRPADGSTDKFLNFLESTASDLEDLFQWEGITSYVCEGGQHDPSRQRILNKVSTDDPSKNKTIAERVRPGYEYNGKIIRPEIVSVFVYENNGSSEDIKQNGQTNPS